MKIVMAFAATGLLALSIGAKTSDEPDARRNKPSQNAQLHAKGSLLFGAQGMAMGPGISVEFPIFRHFSLGGQFNTHLFLEGKATSILDFDVLAKGLYQLRLNGYDAAAYLSLPLGISLAQAGSINVLFNLGLLPGFEFYFNRHWGVYTELGLRLHMGKRALANGEFDLGLSYAF